MRDVQLYLFAYLDISLRQNKKSSIRLGEAFFILRYFVYSLFS